MNIDTATLGATVTAIGALGLAACALVDTSKTLPGGGVSNVGFASIEAAVNLFFPTAPKQTNAPNLAGSFLYTLHANWISGMAAADQKAVAKSLIKLRLTPGTSRQFAVVTQVDPTVLEEVARRMTTGEKLEAQHTNALGRFDLALTAILDAAYQRADQRYRNVSRLWAAVVSLMLAVLGGFAISDPALAYFGTSQMWQALFCGLLAVPLAPITKDLTSALTAGVKVAQSLKR
ncbi:MAG: hypothetical protein WCH35_05590 [Comamonadaceae bacterium]